MLNKTVYSVRIFRLRRPAVLSLRFPTAICYGASSGEYRHRRRDRNGAIRYRCKGDGRGAAAVPNYNALPRTALRSVG
jgi:hypothetical protein